MRTITVYLETESERKRKSRKRHVLALIAASIIAVVVVADRKPPPLEAEVVSPPPAPMTLPQEVKLVYVYTAPIGPPPQPPAPQMTPPAPPKTTPTPKKPPTKKPAPPPPPVVTASVAPPPIVTAPPPQVAPPPPPPRRFRILVDPQRIWFERGGRQRVTVTNPNSEAIVITKIEIPGDEEATAGFALRGESKCLETLQPGESCRFEVSSSRRTPGGVPIRVYHKPAAIP
ncbi:MAG TPA: hypothetical protein VNA69_14710 [Thermoanaerobaculia bacterium]|nr:hypothetical protein [Thermoanaerobaculia bacterium]